jgi:hypothetical protein
MDRMNRIEAEDLWRGGYLLRAESSIDGRLAICGQISIPILFILSIPV